MCYRYNVVFNNQLIILIIAIKTKTKILLKILNFERCIVKRKLVLYNAKSNMDRETIHIDM